MRAICGEWLRKYQIFRISYLRKARNLARKVLLMGAALFAPQSFPWWSPALFELRTLGNFFDLCGARRLPHLSQTSLHRLDDLIDVRWLCAFDMCAVIQAPNLVLDNSILCWPQFYRCRFMVRLFPKRWVREVPESNQFEEFISSKF